MLFVVGVNIWSAWGREGFIDKVVSLWETRMT